MDMRFVGHENINLSKHLNRSGLHLNHLVTPVLTVNFLNVLNSVIRINNSNQKARRIPIKTQAKVRL